MNNDEKKTTAESRPAREKGIKAITLAKKAVETVRNDISCNNALPACRKCGVKHPPFHSCSGLDKSVISKELTKKVTQMFCGNFYTKEAMPKLEPSDKNPRPLYPQRVESKKKTIILVAAINRSEEKVQSEVISTELHAVSTRTATCQCCDSEGIWTIDLYKTDSGQLLCLDCLKSLRNATSCITV